MLEFFKTDLHQLLFLGVQTSPEDANGRWDQRPLSLMWKVGCGWERSVERGVGICEELQQRKQEYLWLNFPQKTKIGKTYFLSCKKKKKLKRHNNLIWPEIFRIQYLMPFCLISPSLGVCVCDLSLLWGGALEKGGRGGLKLIALMNGGGKDKVG